MAAKSKGDSNEIILTIIIYNLSIHMYIHMNILLLQTFIEYILILQIITITTITAIITITVYIQTNC